VNKARRSLSISRLALLYSLAVMALLGLLWGVFWYELENTGERLRQQREELALVEVREAYQAVLADLGKTADALADWDETRHLLIYPDYYQYWRDTRVRDAGKAHPAMDDVGLYNKSGQLLAKSNSADPLPSRAPVTQQAVLLHHMNAHDHVLYFRPIHADPGGNILLGYLGMKLDLAAAMSQLRAFRYADLATMNIQRPADSMTPGAEAAAQLRVRPLADADLRARQDLFQQALVRQALTLLAALILAMVMLRQWLVRPLRDLERHIAQLNAYEDAAQGAQLPPETDSGPPLRVAELESLRESFDAYRRRLGELHGHLEQKSRDFYDQARRDALSGAFNRRAFEEDWSRIAEDRRSGSVALLLFDCDHFKAINDTYGHHVGDAVIQATAACLQSALRAQDRLYRLGGDEFAMLLREADPAQAEMVAERCLEHIHAHDFYQYALKEPISLSVGIALSHGEEHNLTHLQKQADLAMYAAKRPGNNKIVFYGEGMQDMEVLVGNREVNAVFHAIHDPACIEMAYQEVRRLPAAENEYAEALVRVRYDEELLMPAALFPIVQSRGLDADFDLAILQAIRRDLNSGLLAPDLGISVNVSAPGIVNAKVISAVLDLVRSEPQRKIVVEITETALITQMDIATDHIKQLREVGALVALDDFGSGYSSLRYLSHMPVDLVKFDISLVRMLSSGDLRQRQLTQEIATMVMNAGYEVVAEGVETQTLLDSVIELGFTHAQGYLFGKPTR
jgi:diguanylate cyclase (GGDEF)-like protein